MMTPLERIARLKTNPFHGAPAATLTAAEKAAAEALFGAGAPLEPGNAVQTAEHDNYSFLERRRLALEQIPGRTAAVQLLRATMWRWLHGPLPAQLEDFGDSLSGTALWVVGDGDAADLVERALHAAFIDPHHVVRVDARLGGLSDELLFGRSKGNESNKKARRSGALEGAVAPLIVADSKRDDVLLRTVCNAAALGRYLRVGSLQARNFFARVTIVTDVAPSPPPANAVVIEVPPLCERAADIATALAAHLRAASTSIPEAELRHVHDVVIREKLELRAAIGRAWAAVEAAALPAATTVTTAPAPSGVAEGTMTLDEVRSWYAHHVRALSRSDRDAARRLGITRVTLAKLLKLPA